MQIVFSLFESLQKSEKKKLPHSTSHAAFAKTPYLLLKRFENTNAGYMALLVTVDSSPVNQNREDSDRQII
jgi:hypothetical protein